MICTDQRMTYEEVNGILDGDEHLKARYAELVTMFEDMARLAEILKKEKNRPGSA